MYDDTIYAYKITYNIDYLPDTVSFKFDGRYEFGDYDTIKGIMELKGSEFVEIYVEII